MPDAPVRSSLGLPQKSPPAAIVAPTKSIEKTVSRQSDTQNRTAVTEAELAEAQRLAEKAKLEADQAKRDTQAALREAQAALRQTEDFAAEQRAALEAQIDSLRSPRPRSRPSGPGRSSSRSVRTGRRTSCTRCRDSHR